MKYEIEVKCILRGEAPNEKAMRDVVEWNPMHLELLGAGFFWGDKIDHYAVMAIKERQRILSIVASEV